MSLREKFAEWQNNSRYGGDVTAEPYTFSGSFAGLYVHIYTVDRITTDENSFRTPLTLHEVDGKIKWSINNALLRGWLESAGINYDRLDFNADFSKAMDYYMTVYYIAFGIMMYEYDILAATVMLNVYTAYKTTHSFGIFNSGFRYVVEFRTANDIMVTLKAERGKKSGYLTVTDGNDKVISRHDVRFGSVSTAAKTADLIASYVDVDLEYLNND